MKWINRTDTMLSKRKWAQGICYMVLRLERTVEVIHWGMRDSGASDGDFGYLI